MDIQQLISHELWLAISNTYESKNYSHAIIDAMHYLSELIRERSGLDGDGQNLVGAAFGGSTPILRINKLQTITERDIQKGIEQILRGMYQAIRNPRSHDQISDTKNSADSILLFIDYITNIINQSQPPFTIQNFLERVFDQYYVKSEIYAQLLVEEIPQGKLLETLIELYRRKREGDPLSIVLTSKEIIKKLSDDFIHDFINIVSDDLKTTNQEKDVSIALTILEPIYWEYLPKSVRMRIENMSITSIKVGHTNSNGQIFNDFGILAIQSRKYWHLFELKNQLRNAILDKLRADDSEKLFVFIFLLRYLPSIVDNDFHMQQFVNTIVEAIKAEQPFTELKNRLIDDYLEFPDKWRYLISKELPEIEEEIDIPF